LRSPARSPARTREIQKGVAVALHKVEEVREIIGYGVMSTPGVVIDGMVVHAGGVPGRDKIEQWLTAGQA
jgi:predicted thioredoxin/glutaredoxin